MSNFKTKIDKQPLGLLIGIILPIITFFIYVNIAYPTRDLKSVFNLLLASSDNRFGPFTYSLIPSFVLFYLSNHQLRIDKFSYGLVMSTIVISILVVISLLF